MENPLLMYFCLIRWATRIYLFDLAVVHLRLLHFFFAHSDALVVVTLIWNNQRIGNFFKLNLGRKILTCILTNFSKFSNIATEILLSEFVCDLKPCPDHEFLVAELACEFQ